MLNHIVLMGRLVRDPELRRTASGTAVTTFTLAVERDYAPQGEKKQTDFIDIVAWRSTAEFVSKYFAKGQLTVASGRLQTRDWTDNNGNKRKATEIVADHVYFAGGKANGNTAANTPTEPEFAEYEDEDGYGEDGDLPF